MTSKETISNEEQYRLLAETAAELLASERLARAEAEASESRYRALAESIPDQVFAISIDGALEYFNQRTLDYLGLSAGQMSLSAWQERIHPDDFPAVDTIWKEALLRGENLRTEFRLRRHDGAYRWHLAQAIPMRVPTGEIVRFIGTCADIEDEKRANEGQRFLLKASAVLSSSLDTSTTLASVAKLAVPFLADWCVVDIIGEDRHPRRLAIAHRDPDKIELAWDMYRRYPDDPRSSEGVPIVLRTGKPFLVTSVSEDSLAGTARNEEHLLILRELGLKSYVIVPLKARDRVLGAMTFVTSESGREYDPARLALIEDLAQRASIAVDNASLYQEAAQAIETRDNFVGIVSHELRNLLGIILLKVTLLKRKVLGEGAPGRDHADAIQRIVERMNRLIHDLLDLASIEAGRFLLDRTTLDATSLVGDAFDQMQALAEQKLLRLEKKAAGALGTVYADRERVLQVFSNLVGNAIKFTPEGGQITLEASAGQGEVQFTVIDTGGGIADDQVPFIFDRFWRVKQAHRQGTGLGLSIAKGIVDAHGGRIWVETRMNEGSRFHFTLPSQPSEPSESSEGAGTELLSTLQTAPGDDS